MRRLPHLLMILNVSVFIAANDATKSPKSDGDEIHGLWMFTDTWIDGTHEKHPTTHEGDVKIPSGVQISKERIEFGLFLFETFVTFERLSPQDADVDLINILKFTIDTTTTPKQLDWKLKKNEKEKRGRGLGVYLLEKDTLILCFYGVRNEPFKQSKARRPKSVAKRGKKGDGLTIWVFKRVRPKN